MLKLSTIGSMKKKHAKSRTSMNIVIEVTKWEYCEHREVRGFNIRDPIKLPIGQDVPISAAFSANPTFMK